MLSDVRNGKKKNCVRIAGPQLKTTISVTVQTWKSNKMSTFMNGP